MLRRHAIITVNCMVVVQLGKTSSSEPRNMQCQFLGGFCSHQVVQRSVSSDTRSFLSNAGAFHVAVEICGTEWSYGYAETEGLGIFYHEPRKCLNHSFVKAIYLGDCKKKTQELW